MDDELEALLDTFFKERKMKEDDVQIAQEIVVRAAEHEQILSFNADWMAEAFADWWEIEGRLIFVDWATANEDEY